MMVCCGARQKINKGSEALRKIDLLRAKKKIHFRKKKSREKKVTLEIIK